MKQGELNGILKELGYTADQVSDKSNKLAIKSLTGFLFPGLQVLSNK